MRLLLSMSGKRDDEVMKERKKKDSVSQFCCIPIAENEQQNLGTRNLNLNNRQPGPLAFGHSLFALQAFVSSSVDFMHIQSQ
jgi:hypothetical protein